MPFVVAGHGEKLMLDELGPADPGFLKCMVAFDSVGVGDREAYARAFIKAQRTVKDPILQLALVDCIIAARTRAYGRTA